MGCEAKVDGRKVRGEKTRELSYRRVVLAVYILADGEIGSCFATTADIAKQARCSVEVAARSIRQMVARGLASVVVFGVKPGYPSGRSIVLMDYPRAEQICVCWKKYLDLNGRSSGVYYKPAVKRQAKPASGGIGAPSTATSRSRSA